MFVDKAEIRLRAGRGGNGAVSFLREKYVASGGPDGGDGGRGGDVVIKIDDHLATLMDFKYKFKYEAENGANGSSRQKSGRAGENLIISVPRGTLIRDTASGRIIKDMSLSEGENFVLARGGRGGWGNRRFATPTRQAPRFAKPGLPGEELEVMLELKLLADVGLVGFPNVGKSTLLSVVSKANPRIANYHFTTLYPNLGVVFIDEGASFVMADIPGLIEGASEGIGLGHDFLRHVDRCRLLLHIVDVSGSEGRDPIEDFEAVWKEMREWSPELADRPQLVVANKCDILGGDREPIVRLAEHVARYGFELFEISAVTHAGTLELMNKVYERLLELPPTRSYEPEYVPELRLSGTSEDLEVEIDKDGIWNIEGEWLVRLIERVNFSDYESRNYFDRVLREAGIFDRLEQMGIDTGDTVRMYSLEFEYEI